LGRIACTKGFDVVDANIRKFKVALLSVVSNSILVIIKILVGLIMGSVSIMSEAIHSGIDLLASIITLFSVTTSDVPADEVHPFGHGKVENISGAVEALLIFVAAAWIIYEAVGRLLNPRPIELLGFGVCVMLLSAALNIIVSQMLFKVGKQTESVALQADAWHLRTDVYTSLGVMAGLAIILVGERIFPNTDFNWIDPMIACGVAVLIIKAAYDLTLQSARDLIDTKLPAEEEAWIRQFVLEYQGPIRGFHKLRTRKSGHFRFIDFHIKVEPDMSVGAADLLTDELSAKIKEHFPTASITIKTETCNSECASHCLAGCLLSGQQRHDVTRRKEQQKNHEK
jgi:cation diffusion facilitator family transporter